MNRRHLPGRTRSAFGYFQIVVSERPNAAHFFSLCEGLPDVADLLYTCPLVLCLSESNQLLLIVFRGDIDGGALRAVCTATAD